jgi:integrase
VAGRLLNPQVTWWPVSPEDIVDSRKAQTRGQARKHGKPSLDQIEFYRVLDSLPSRLRPYFVTLALTGLKEKELCELQSVDLDQEARAIRVKAAESESKVRTIYVAEDLWAWVRAAVPVKVTYRYLRDHWSAALDRAELEDVPVSHLLRFRDKLLAETKDRRLIRLVADESREEAVLLAQALRALALTEDEARRLVLRRIEG